MKNFFTADTHFDHANIIRLCNRPFADVNEMNEALITNWNSVVSPEDNVFHLGDFSFKEVNRHLYRLNGNIHFVYGNHDKTLKRYYNEAPRLKGIVKGQAIPAETEIHIEGTMIVLGHYAMRVWNKSHHGSWMLYGHSHGSLPDDPNSMSFDVGVDCHDFFPITFERVREIMSVKTFKPIDHHGKNPNDAS